MQYKIETIGTSFTNKDIVALEKHFSEYAAHGYKFHSVFQIQQPGGCLGLGPTTLTYLAIYVKEK